MIGRWPGAFLAAAMVPALAPGTALAQDAPYGPLRPDQLTFRALYKELVETNTSSRTALHPLAPRWPRI